MKENEWISVEENLPPVNKTIEVKDEGIFSCRIIKAKLLNNEIGNFSFYSFNEKIIHPIYWRHLPEKRPDFSKLKRDDLVVIEYKNSNRIGFVGSIYERQILINSDSLFEDCASSVLDKDKIKKITRINLGKKTFEEI